MRDQIVVCSPHFGHPSQNDTKEEKECRTTCTWIWIRIVDYLALHVPFIDWDWELSLLRECCYHRFLSLCLLARFLLCSDRDWDTAQHQTNGCDLHGIRESCHVGVYTVCSLTGCVHSHHMLEQQMRPEQPICCLQVSLRSTFMHRDMARKCTFVITKLNGVTCS